MPSLSKKYFGYDNARVVIVGKTDQFSPRLIKSGFLVKQYDLYAKSVGNYSPANPEIPILNAKNIIKPFLITNERTGN